MSGSSQLGPRTLLDSGIGRLKPEGLRATVKPDERHAGNCIEFFVSVDASGGGDVEQRSDAVGGRSSGGADGEHAQAADQALLPENRLKMAPMANSATPEIAAATRHRYRRNDAETG